MSRSDVIKILKEFKAKDAEKYGILVLGIFGSVARDQATDKSDVDVFLETKIPDPFNIVHIKQDLEKQLHQHVDIVRLRERMNPFLKKRIEKEAVYV
ncbi:nucleotidyltransferase domain-containing protein [bacterium]|nr:nucleotidyltransferase domain-containing protein [bacterium]